MIRATEVRAKSVGAVAGLMTGTSMDGLDVAFCRVTSAPRSPPSCCVRERAPAGGSAAPRRTSGSPSSAPRTARHGARPVFRRAVAGVLARHPPELDLIGSHGQTVYHEHRVTTLQLGAPAPLALRFGCPVVHDFRAADIAAGGAGAPLVPYVDHRLLGGRGAAILAVNIGGIANFTGLPATDDLDLVIGMDCGPGNMVLDELARRVSSGAMRSTSTAAWPRAAGSCAALLAERRRHPFFAASPPKSAGREQFGSDYVDALLARRGRRPSRTGATCWRPRQSSRRSASTPAIAPRRAAAAGRCGDGQRRWRAQSEVMARLTSASRRCRCAQRRLRPAGRCQGGDRVALLASERSTSAPPMCRQ